MTSEGLGEMFEGGVDGELRVTSEQIGSEVPQPKSRHIKLHEFSLSIRPSVRPVLLFSVRVLDLSVVWICQSPQIFRLSIPSVPLLSVSWICPWSGFVSPPFIGKLWSTILRVKDRG